MSEEKQPSIMTPVFEGTRYLHHVCSECNGTLKFEQSCFGDVSFYDIHFGECEHIKFCPLCGREVVRFSDKPIYVTPIDLTPLDVFAKLHLEYERKAKWLYHCYISDEHREKIKALLPLIDKGEISVYFQRALDMAEAKGTYKPTVPQMRTLRKEFGEDRE